MYAPIIKSAIPVREYVLGNEHTAVLLTSIESDDAQPLIEYTYLLVVFHNDRENPVFFISSEAASAWSTTARDPAPWDRGRKSTSGTHFLCTFAEDGHRNFGSSDEWADLDKFEHAALEMTKRIQQGL